MPTIAEVVVQKRMNFARFILENTLEQSRPLVQKHVEKMLSLDPAVFIGAIRIESAGKSDEELTKSLLTLVGCTEADFNSDAKPKFLLYLRMFCELAEQ